MTAFDVDAARAHFPAFSEPGLRGQPFFENAGGSFACRQTIEALDRYYRATKVQPYAPYQASRAAGEAMDHSRTRWAEALGVDHSEVQFGPSTSMNTYVLANAFAEILGPGDEVIVTNQDHEANTGAVRRMVERVGARLVEWRVDETTGLLDLDRLGDVLTAATRLITLPHASNIIGQENDIAAVTAMARGVGARTIVDGVSFAPHSLPDVAALGADIYLFSLYKVYSVHQGLMVTRHGVIDELPNQGHFFNSSHPSKRLTPAGPDHAQEAAAGAVLDYVEALYDHHLPNGQGDTGAARPYGLRAIVEDVSRRWRDHETSLLQPVLAALANNPAVRLLGPGIDDADRRATNEDRLHRCPTVAFVPLERSPSEVVEAMLAHDILCASGDFYAKRVLEGLGVDSDRGVVRLSWVHYTSADDIDRLLEALAVATG